MRAPGTTRADFTGRLAALAMSHDRRGNVVAHAFAIPLYALAAATLLGLLRVRLGPMVLTAADLGWLPLAVFWVRLDPRLGSATALAAFVVLLLGNHLAAQGWFDGLLAVLAVTVLATGFELAGHAMEGRPPAVLTDRMAPAVAPIFLAATAAFTLGLRETLAEDVDRRVRGAIDHPAPFEPAPGL